MNYKLFQMKLKADFLEREADELAGRIKARLLKIDQEMNNFAKAQSSQTPQPQGTSTHPAIGETQPEAKPLNCQEIYAIAQDPQKWNQFMEEIKPELMAVWGRRSA